jgi:hypothetical protein
LLDIFCGFEYNLFRVAKGLMASIYENGGKRIRVSVNLTPFQRDKLEKVCDLFGVSYQRFLADCVDYYFMEYLEVATGRVDLNHSIQNAMEKLLDDMVKLRTSKGLVPHTLPSHLNRSQQGFRD